MSGIKSYSGQMSAGERAALSKYREKGLDEYFPALALKKQQKQSGFFNPFDVNKSKGTDKENFEFKPLKSIDVDRRNYALENIIKETIKNNDELARIKREKYQPYNLNETAKAVTVDLSPEAKDAVSGDEDDLNEGASTTSTNDATNTSDTTPQATSSVNTIV